MEKVHQGADSQEIADYQGQSVLVVDDMPDNRLLMQIYLKPFHLNVSQAKSGEEALEMIPKNSPDLTFLDIQMPGMDGYEVTRKLRAQGYSKPIVALTAFAQQEEIKKCRDAGFDQVLTKPIGRQGVADALQQFLSSRTKQ
jgi:CheY-like chemotaxis protein